MTSTPSTGWPLEFQPSCPYFRKQEEGKKREKASSFPVRTLTRKCTVFASTPLVRTLSHVLAWLQGKLGNALSRWPCAWLSLGVPIIMEEKENRGWDKQRTLSTSKGLKMPVKNCQAFYKAVQKQSCGKTRTESKSVQLWWPRVSCGGGRQPGHWHPDKEKRDCFAGVRVGKKGRGQVQVAACGLEGEPSRHRPWGSVGEWSINIWQTKE